MVGFVGMPRRRWSQRRVGNSGYAAIRPFCRFEAAGAAKSSTNALACAMRTTRTSTAVLGKAVSNAGSSGHHEITNSTPRTPSIGPDIEAWKGEYEAQITSTKNARWKAFLDALGVDGLFALCS